MTNRTGALDLALVVSCPLGNDTVILDLTARLYFSLDNVSAMIWQLIQQPKSVKELREAILETFEVERGVCERDLLAPAP